MRRVAMEAAKAEPLDNLETEFGEAGNRTAPASPRPHRWSKLRAGLVAAVVGAAVLGVSLVQNPSPAAAADDCLHPQHIKLTHWRYCSVSANVYHRYLREEWRYNANHVYDCYVFHSTLYAEGQSPVNFDPSSCATIY
jgi:hypothetical protein